MLLGQDHSLTFEKDTYRSHSQAWRSLAGAGVGGGGEGHRQVTRLSPQGCSSDGTSTLPSVAFPVRVLKAYSVRQGVPLPAGLLRRGKGGAGFVGNSAPALWSVPKHLVVEAAGVDE